MSRGAPVTLRPFKAEEVEIVWAARRRRAGPTAPVTPGTRRAIQRQVERSGELREGFLRLAIEAGGRLVGEIDARCPVNAYPPGVFELGIELYEEADRGRGHGAAAVELIVDRLFGRERAERVQASTAVGNVAMRRVLEKVGFSYEGTLRSFMPADGGREDYILYALTREDWLGP